MEITANNRNYRYKENMESFNNTEALDVFKMEIVLCFKKYHENLSNQNQEFKSRLTEAQKRNEVLQERIQYLTNISLTTPTTSTVVMPNETRALLESFEPDLKNKLKQLRTVKETISAKSEQETKSSEQKYYEMLTKDEVFLKPYHEVEEATKELEQKTEIILKKCEEEKAIFLDNLRKGEQDFIQLKTEITDWEPIEKEMRLEVQNLKKHLEQKLKSLNLKSTEDATMDSFEYVELLKEISDLKSQLNKN